MVPHHSLREQAFKKIRGRKFEWKSVKQSRNKGKNRRAVHHVMDQRTKHFEIGTSTVQYSKDTQFGKKLFQNKQKPNFLQLCGLNANSL